MRQFLAVIFQMTIAASNYALFTILAHKLESSDFIMFTTAVGINMLAFAIAEGGTSYTAPKETSNCSKEERPHLSGAFISISIIGYLTTLSISFLTWKTFTPSETSIMWTVAYTSIFIPTLISPAWLIQEKITIYINASHILARALPLVAIYLYPTKETLLASGSITAIYYTTLNIHFNRNQKLLSLPKKKHIKSALKTIRSIFFTKTLTYALFGSIPMAINITCGSLTSSIYISGERLRTLYVALTQPLTQTFFLYFCRENTENKKTKIAIYLATFNITLVTMSLYFFPDINHLLLDNKLPKSGYLFIIAGFLATSSSIITLLYILPNRFYDVFSRATLTQSIAIVIVFASLYLTRRPEPSLVLLIAELVFFLATLLFFLQKLKSNSNAKVQC